MLSLKNISVFGVVLFLTACSSTPKSSQEKISQEEATAFLKKYCSIYSAKSSLDQELTGDIVVRSSTKEFKGQYPASVHFSKDKSFTMEVTNLIGGTIAILKGEPSSIEVFSSGRPQYNRKGIKQYMGLSIPLFAKLLHGDLPCPDSSEVKVSGNEILITDAGMEWRIEKSDRDSGAVPVRVRVLEKGKTKIELLVEKWNIEQSYAEKVKVHTSEGDLKWTWRSRELK
jgi:hypothetical protein